MPDIFHNLPIKASAQRVFEAISTPGGLNSWWTNNCSTTPSKDSAYELGFGPGYDWRATASQWLPDSAFELKFTDADGDWQGTRVGFRLVRKKGHYFGFVLPSGLAGTERALPNLMLLLGNVFETAETLCRTR